jgi:cell pole-organizing protein PopZ
MRKPEQAPEPSIEEILASIRRIIADDAPGGPAAAGDSRGQPHIQAVPPARPQAAGGRQGEEEVLELTEDFMLADEASAVNLQEQDEPAEFADADPYRGASDDRGYSDPYGDHDSDQAGQQAFYASEPEERAIAAPNEALTAVMAEVRRASDASKGRELPQQAPQPQQASEPQQGAEPPRATQPRPAPQEFAAAPSWGQPDVEALMPASRSQPQSKPVWSARHKPSDSGKPFDEASAVRPAGPADPVASNTALGVKENWSMGVQMPVPEGGPAIPFPTDEDLAAPFNRQPAPNAGTSPRQPWTGEAAAAEAVEAMPATSPQDAPRPVPSAVHMRAEAIADKAVSDFADDKFSAPPVADILKADKPFMEAITSTLVDVLSRGKEVPDEEFEDAPHLDDFDEGSFTSSELEAELALKPAAPAKSASEAKPHLAALDTGFMAAHPIAAKQPEAATPDQETPELPREDLDDMVPPPSIGGVEIKVHPAIEIPEPAPMPNMPTVSGRTTSGPVASRGPVPAAERLQPVSQGQKSLEETVKELLKPMLLQWLDENMPRIVNEAIREEIAANGLLPRARDGRR